jgi:hypothetical protein
MYIYFRLQINKLKKQLKRTKQDIINETKESKKELNLNSYDIIKTMTEHLIREADNCSISLSHTVNKMQNVVEFN